jgi:hypothetical protein
MNLRPTFSNGWDRLTYLLASYRYIVAGILAFLGLVIGLTEAEIPGAPPWVGDFIAATLLFGPVLFIAGLRFVRWVRNRNRVNVYEVNAIEDTVEKYLVAPETWREKTVEGADPYPVNAGGGWAVRELDYQEGIDSLVVTGVWLSELEDTKLYTEKQHMRSMYSKLLESHLALAVMRNSLREMGGDIQTTVMNRVAMSIERGTHLEKTGVEEVFDDYEQDVEGIGPDELPDLPEDLEDLDADPEATSQPEATADGGESDP